jgi:hypothetical protein
MRDLHNLKDFYMAELREYFMEDYEGTDEQFESDFQLWLKDLSLKEIREITGEE